MCSFLESLFAHEKANYGLNLVLSPSVYSFLHFYEIILREFRFEFYFLNSEIDLC